MENFEGLDKNVRFVFSQISNLKKMKFQIKSKSSLHEYNNLINEFEEFQHKFCKGKVKVHDFSIEYIVQRLNQIEHSEDEEDIYLLKNL